MTLDGKVVNLRGLKAVYDAAQEQLSAIRSAVGSVGGVVRTFGSPEPSWAVGSLNASGGAMNTPKSSIRSGTFSARAGSVISMNEGYRMRVYLYDAPTGEYTARTDWTASYTFTEDCRARLLVSDAEHAGSSAYEMPDTACSGQVDWSGFVLTRLDEQVAPLLAARDQLASGGYLDITRALTLNGKIYTGTSAGSTLTLDIVEEKNYVCGKIAVRAGDVFRLSGDARGNGNYRLWAFTDEEGKVLSISAVFLNESDLVVTAPGDGYLIYNANGSAARTPKVEQFCRTIDSAADVIRMNREYDELNTGHDILSAFTNIMCCGDSLTASVVYTGKNGDDYVTRAAYRRYPQILAAKTGAEVEYRAMGGYTAADWWAAYHQHITAKTNQLAIIYLGTNGGLTDTMDTDAPGDDPADYADTNTGCYCRIVKSFIDAGARVLLIRINKRDSGLFTTNEVIDKIADRYRCAAVTVPHLADDKYHLYPDGSGKNSLHYNDLGYAAFTESLIRHVGALPDEMTARLIPE